MRSLFDIAVRRFAAGSLAMFCGVWFADPAIADGFRLAPLTKLRIEVSQWDPTKGDFHQWDVLSREITVAGDGTISLPAIGTIDAAALDAEQLAGIVSRKLKEKVGLIDLPDATVSVLEYPPIYVVGDVATPGEFKFRPGMSVLQALTLGGGLYRETSSDSTKDIIVLNGQETELRDDLLRGDGRIARLRAERDGTAAIDFPPSLRTGSTTGLAAEVVVQENAIRSARRVALDRQAQTLAELQELLRSEIQILGEKASSLDRQVAVAEQEFDGVKSLYDKGVATAARRSEIERALMNLKSDRLDQMAATMRARQALSSAERDAAALLDKHRMDVALELQEAEAAREKLLIKQATGRAQMDHAVAEGDMKGGSQERIVDFAIVRHALGATNERSASETSPMEAGDTLKVTVRKATAVAAGGALAERFAATQP